MKIPPDIVTMIKKMYPKLPEQTEVEAFLVGLWTTPLNVGPAQLARAILHLSAGDIAEVRKIKASNFFGDPRDLIMMANQKPGNKGTDPYFNEPFYET